MEADFDEDEDVIYDKTRLLVNDDENDEPVSRESPNWNLSWLVALVAIFVCLGLSLAMPGPLLPCLENLTHSREDQVSLIFTGRAVGRLGGVLMGRLMAELCPGRPHILIAGSILTLTGAHLLTPWPQHIWWLMPAFALQGAAIAAAMTGGFNMIQRLFGLRSTGYKHLLLLALALGCLLAPFIAMPFFDNLSGQSRIMHTSSTPVPPSSDLGRRRREVSLIDVERENLSDINLNTTFAWLNHTTPKIPDKVTSSSSITTAVATTMTLPEVKPTKSKKPSITDGVHLNQDSHVASGGHLGTKLKQLEKDQRLQKLKATIKHNAMSSVTTTTSTTLSPSTVTLSNYSHTTVLQSNNSQSIVLQSNNSHLENSSDVTLPYTSELHSVAFNSSDFGRNDSTPSPSNIKASSTVRDITTTTVSRTTQTTTRITTSSPVSTSLRSTRAVSVSLSTAPTSTISSTTTHKSSTPSQVISSTTSKATPAPKADVVTTKSTKSASTLSPTVATVYPFPKPPETVPGSTLDQVWNTTKTFVNKLSGLSGVQKTYLLLGFLNLLVFIVILPLTCCCAPPPRPDQMARDIGLVSRRSQSTITFKQAAVLACVGFVHFLYAGIEVAFGCFLYSFAVRYLLWSQLNGLLVTGVFWCGYAIGRIPSLISCWRARVLAIFHIILIVGAGVGMVLSPHQTSSIWLWVGAGSLGLALSGVWPSLSAWIASHPRGDNAVLLGGCLGEMVIPVVTGYLHRVLNSPLVLVHLTLICGLGIAVVQVGLFAFERRWRDTSLGPPVPEDLGVEEQESASEREITLHKMRINGNAGRSKSWRNGSTSQVTTSLLNGDFEEEDEDELGL